MKVGAACLIIVNPFELVWDRNKPDRILFLVAYASNSISVDLYSENPYAPDVCCLIEYRVIIDVNSYRCHLRYYGLGACKSVKSFDFLYFDQPSIIVAGERR